MYPAPAAPPEVTPEEVRTQRLVLVVASGLFPLIGLALARANPALVDPLAVRVLLSAGVLVVVAASAAGRLGAPAFQRAVWAASIAFLLHLLALEWVNGLSLTYYGGIAVVLFIGMVLQSSPSGVVSYGLVAAGAGVLVALTTADAASSRARFALSIAGFAVMAGMLSFRRLELIRALAERDRRLTLALAARERLSLVVDASTDFIAFGPLGPGFSFVNPAARRLLGAQADTPLAVLWGRLSPASLAELERSAWPVLAAGRAWEGKLRFGRLDHGEIWLECSLFPLPSDGGPAAVGAVMRDVTAREELDRLRDHFVSTVSHELRTPLSAIHGALALLDGGAVGALDARATTLVGIARSNSERLIRLINDILDFQRMRIAAPPLKCAAASVAEVVASALAAVQPLADQRGVGLVAAVTPEPFLVWADADRVAQVLINLLSNAIRFSPDRGQVVVRAQREAGVVRIVVEDEGPGVPEAHVSSLFVPFQQAESASSRHRGGSGLGLAISKAIVEHHGGVIGYEATEQGGACFAFTLPAGEAGGAVPASRPRALVVGDDEIGVAELDRLLVTAGFEVRVARSGAEAVEALAAGRAQAVVVDLARSTPALDDALAQARAGRHPPTILVLDGLAGRCPVQLLAALSEAGPLG